MDILLTGASGFLGKSIRRNLAGHQIISLARTNADIIADISKETPVLPSSDIVIHCAGKAHLVPTSKEERSFFEVNVRGTENILKGLGDSSLPKSFVFISTVAVYGQPFGLLINEEAPLMATSAYGASKIEAERIVRTWCLQNNVICTILRLPLIAGPNPPGNLGSMIAGIKKGYYFNIAGGTAKKSIVLAEDVAQIIPIVANIGGIYNLTDGCHPSFLDLSELIAIQLHKKRPANIPAWLAKIIAKAGDFLGSKAPINSDKLKKITSDLTFDDSKARELLGWNPTPVLKGFKIT